MTLYHITAILIGHDQHRGYVETKNDGINITTNKSYYDQDHNPRADLNARI